MGQTHNVIFAPQANRDIKMIVRYIARRGGAEIAVRFGTQLVERALTLSSLPERGRVVPEVGEPFREIIFKSYRIVYRLKPGAVEVVRLWHAARGIPQIDSDEFGSQGKN